MRSRWWLRAAAVVLPLLAACTSTAARPGPGPGPGGRAAGSSSGTAGLPHLGDAAMPQVRSFGWDVFDKQMSGRTGP